MSYLRPALALLAAAALLAPAAAPLVETLLPENPWLGRRVLHIAHQGGEREAPSNTLYALKTALAKGADVLEIDVHATKDGHLAVLHDTTVDRTTNGADRVDQMTLAEVQALDAAYWFAPGCNPPCATGPYPYRGIATGAVAPPPGFPAADFRIPTLDEVLAAFPGVLLNIEIKRTAPDTVPYEHLLAAALRAHDRGTDTIVVSFFDAATEIFRAHDGGRVSTATGTAETALFWASAQGPAPGAPSHHHALQVPIVFNGITVVTPDFVANAHARGLAVHVWTIHDAAEMRALVCMGVDGIMTSVPTVLEAELASYGSGWTC